MKGRLFWKILFGFWLTFMVITESVWLIYEVVRPTPSDLTRALASISLAAAETAIHLGGLPALQAQVASWPNDERGRLIVRPWTQSSRLQKDIEKGEISIRAADPAGHAYWVAYDVRLFRFAGHGPLDIPREILALALAGGLIFSASLAWYLTKPARQMQIGFDRLSAGDFTTRLGPAMGRRRDEMADLARAFDRMAVHLQELVAARDRLLADVSHELRSPLARLQLAIDLARQDPEKLGVSQERVSAEAARLDEMVGELLTLSKLENGVQNSEEYFDLVDVVRLVVEDARFEATPLGVAILAETPDFDSEQEWIVSGSGRLMRRAIENILRNAIRFSRAGQSVSVTLSRAKGRLLLVIADEGPGVPAKQEVGPLFQPFFQARPGDDHGYGLGLSIAQRAINALGGSIEAANRIPSGFVVTIAIPEML